VEHLRSKNRVREALVEFNGADRECVATFKSIPNKKGTPEWRTFIYDNFKMAF
jgi:hypothetical protein